MSTISQVNPVPLKPEKDQGPAKPESELYRRFKSFDVYRKVPQDLTEPTFSGAIMTIISTSILIGLCAVGLMDYLEPEIHTEMFVNANQQGEQMQINIDVVLPRIPCSLLNLDAQDIVGTHSVNVGGELYKRALDKNGQEISVSNYTSEAEIIGDASTTPDNFRSKIAAVNKNQAVDSLMNQEGCQLFGFIKINRVPGNFHLSSHTSLQSGSLEIIMRNARLTTLDFSHKINHLSFGPKSSIDYIKK